MGKLGKSILVTLLLLAALLFTAADSEDVVDPLTEARLNKVKNEVHMLQVAIERFGIDHSTGTKPDFESRYPHSLSQLVRPQGRNNVGYAKPGFYHNPFAPGADGELNAMQVPFAWSEQAVGNFSYLTQYNDAGDVVAYVLVAYGPLTGVPTIKITADDQPDGIIVTMTSGNVDHETPQEFFDTGQMVELDWRAVERETPVDELAETRLSLVKNGMHSLQLAVERFGVDHMVGEGAQASRYPHSLSQLVMPLTDYSSYVEAGFYHNPYAEGEAGELNAKQVPFGWNEAAIGNFSYLAQYNDEGEATGYLLVAYGPQTGERGFNMVADGRPDGIILALLSGHIDTEVPQDFLDCGNVVTVEWDCEE